MPNTSAFKRLFWKVHNEPACLPILIDIGLMLVVVGGIKGDLNTVIHGAVISTAGALGYMYLTFMIIVRIKNEK